jgi:4-amino-4-deoxy-L-arabinose transferase-like glycosyltransferase
VNFSIGSAILRKLEFHWPLVLVASLALPLLLIHLGSDYLWEDEGDTAAFAVNILKYGVPRAWDGVTFIDSDAGAPLNDHLVLISHPWLQYYLTAGSFLVFGQNNWAARFPFAVAGWLTILVTYLCAYDLTKNRWVAFCSATLLTGSLQFLLFSRQCRYYPLSMLLGCLLVWIFLNLKSVRSGVLFAIVGILLFHSHPFGIVLVGALGVVSFVYPFFAPQRRVFYCSSAVIGLLILPWIAFVRAGYVGHSELVTSSKQFLGRIIQYAIESASVTPLIGIVVLLFIFAMSGRVRRAGDDLPGQQALFLDRRQLGFLFITMATLICYALVMATVESSDAIWRVGIRYTIPVLPLTAIAAAALIVNVSRGRVWIWLPLLLVFIFTNVAQLTPWIFWGEKTATFDGKESVRAHLPQNSADRYLSTGQLLAFLRDLKTENPGTLAKVCQFLQGHANAGDLVLTNYDWQPLYFYTRLPQALRIFPDYPIYQTAKRDGLPEYVFSLDRVRWLVWRSVWDRYMGYFGQDIRRKLVDGGARMTKVAEFPETIFENRPEIHFHRFSGDKYFFIALDNHVTAQIFRIDWPGVLRMEPSDQPN